MAIKLEINQEDIGKVFVIKGENVIIATEDRAAPRNHKTIADPAPIVTIAPKAPAAVTAKVAPKRVAAKTARAKPGPKAGRSSPFKGVPRSEWGKTKQEDQAKSEETASASVTALNDEVKTEEVFSNI